MKTVPIDQAVEQADATKVFTCRGLWAVHRAVGDHLFHAFISQAIYFMLFVIPIRVFTEMRFFRRMRKYGRLGKSRFRRLQAAFRRLLPIAFTYLLYSGGFYLFTCRNTPVMFFNGYRKRKKAKCMQSNTKCISAAQVRAIGKSRLNCTKYQLFNSKTSYDFHTLH